jgi:hypothetical protein
MGRTRTLDPLDAAVIRFWRQAVDDVYRRIPDLGGFVVAPAVEENTLEGEYGRTHADAANAIAMPLRAHAGSLIYVTDSGGEFDWRRLEGLIDEPRFDDVLVLLEYQAGHAQVWRDAVSNWLARTSGVADAEDRVGKHPRRIEAEQMQLDGYEARDATPWESASGGQFVACTSPDDFGSVRWKFTKKSGWMNIDVYYFDERDGVSQFRLVLGEQVIAEWSADLALPDDEPNGHTATRHRTANVALRAGDELRIEAIADGGERACIDYVEILPAE